MNPKLKVRGTKKNIEVQVNEKLAKSLEDEIIIKWQEILDLAVQMYGIPAALIMKLHENDLEIFAKSSNAENKFVKNKHVGIGIGHYCETVIGTDEMLYVKDGTKDPYWRNSPDVKGSMINYLGLPLKWPSGEAFGTMCMLDKEVNEYTKDQIDLFMALKENIEKDLTLVDGHEKLKESLDQLEKTHDLLIEHEKNHLTNQLVSSISHQISTPLHVALTTAEYLDVAVSKLTEENVLMNSIEEGTGLVQKNIEEAAALIKSFKKLASDQGRQKLELVNLHDYVSSIILGLKYDIRKKGLSVTNEISNTHMIKTYPGILAQVVIQLLIHGILPRSDSNTNLSVSYDQKSLFFTDDGKTIDPETVNRLFDPFVSLNETEETSGLGLAIVKEMVEKVLGGSILCLSADGKTSFEIVMSDITN